MVGGILESTVTLSVRLSAWTNWPSVHLCLEDIIRTAQPFVTKLCMVMHHHVNKMGCCLQCHSEGLQKDIIKIWLFLLYHLKYSFASKHSMIVGHHKPKCLVKILECCVHGHGHSKHSNFQLFVQIASEQWTAQPFVTKLDVATYHCMLLSTRSRSQWGLMRAYKFIHSTY